MNTPTDYYEASDWQETYYDDRHDNQYPSMAPNNAWSWEQGWGWDSLEEDDC